MHAGGERQSSEQRSRRWQIRLADLTIGVLGAGLAIGVARGAKEVWGSRSVGAAMGSVPWERTAGLVLEVLAVFLVLILASAIRRLIQGGFAADPGHRMRLCWAVAWRIAGAALLLVLVVEESRILRLDSTTESRLAAETPGWGAIYRLRQALVPVCGYMVILGLALGMGSGMLFDAPVPARRRWYWLFVPLAGVTGLLLAANNLSQFPYLVLIALEAVNSAMRRPLISLPSFASRMLRTGIDCSVGAMICLALALVVARDFDRARRNQPWATSWLGRAIRLIVLCASVGSAIFLARVTIPAIHPWVSEGIALVVGPGELLIVFAGFCLLSGGLAARSLDPRPALQKPRWMTRVTQALGLGALALAVLTALAAVPPAASLAPLVPWPIRIFLGLMQEGREWLQGRLPDQVAVVVNQALQAESLLWGGITLGLIVLVGEAAFRPSPDGVAPFDSAFNSPEIAIRFIWLTMGLTAVCLFALLIFGIGGPAILHVRLNAGDWLVSGLPRLR
jgi:hypothetical protein